MPDSSVLVFDSDEVSELMITVACECYSHHERIGDLLRQLPKFEGQLTWGAPSKPDSCERRDGADLVLVVSDKTHLATAIERTEAYKKLGCAVLLIYVHDDDAVLAESVPGLILPYLHLASGLFSLAQALFTPVIPDGLVCIDWVDTRHFLALDGPMVIEEARGSQLEAVIETAVASLKMHAAGRAIMGLQASILCSQAKLSLRHVHQLVSMCRTVVDENGLLFIGAPHLDWPESEQYEVRLAARMACHHEREPN